MDGISFCMIVKDEEEVINECLKSIQRFMSVGDEVIVVDTGSKDKTRELALRYTDKVFDFEWCNDFAKARNYSVSKAENDWVLVVDADEVVEELDLESLKEFMKRCEENRTHNIGRVKRINVFEDNFGEKKYIERVNRFFNRNYFRYRGIIHEQIVHYYKKTNQHENVIYDEVCKSNEYITDICEENVCGNADSEHIDNVCIIDNMGNFKDNVYELENIDIILNHIGYTKEVIGRTNKIERNINLLKESLKEKEDPYIYYQLGKSFFMGKDYKEAVYNFEKALEFKMDFALEYVMDLVLSYGYALLNLEKYQEALLGMEKYVDIYKEVCDFNFLMGNVYMNNVMFNDAIKYFKKCIGESDGMIEGINSYLPNYNIGVIYECLGHENVARAYYKRCGIYRLAHERLDNINK